MSITQWIIIGVITLSFFKLAKGLWKVRDLLKIAYMNGFNKMYDKIKGDKNRIEQRTD